MLHYRKLHEILTKSLPNDIGIIIPKNINNYSPSFTISFDRELINKDSPVHKFGIYKLFIRCTHSDDFSGRVPIIETILVNNSDDILYISELGYDINDNVAYFESYDEFLRHLVFLINYKCDMCVNAIENPINPLRKTKKFDHIGVSEKNIYHKRCYHGPYDTFSFNELS